MPYARRMNSTGGYYFEYMTSWEEVEAAERICGDAILEQERIQEEQRQAVLARIVPPKRYPFTATGKKSKIRDIVIEDGVTKWYSYGVLVAIKCFDHDTGGEEKSVLRNKFGSKHCQNYRLIDGDTKESRQCGRIDKREFDQLLLASKYKGAYENNEI